MPAISLARFSFSGRAMDDTAGSAAAPAARCRKFRRGSFILKLCCNVNGALEARPCVGCNSGSFFGSGLAMPDILMPPGKYRIAFHPTITKGSSYLGFACKKCQKPILMFSDPSKGSVVGFNMLQLVGPGTFVIECYHCGHDDEYAGTDLSQFKAPEDRPSFRDKRSAASGSPRQKFQPRYPGAKAIFGVGALEHRQDCAVVISRCVLYLR
jgi:hypothetical protein